MSGKTYYDVVGVAADATAEQIRQAYLVRMKVMHPDRFDQAKQAQEWKMANALLEELNGAYATLRDPSQRRQYDAKMRKSAPSPQPAASKTGQPNPAPSRATPPRNEWSGPAHHEPRASSAASFPAQPRSRAKGDASAPHWATEFVRVVVVLGLVGVFVFSLYISRHNTLPSLLVSHATPTPSAPDVEERPFPQDGTVYGYSADGELADQPRPGTALFTIRALSDDKFFVKMIDAANGRPVLGFAASPNSVVTVKVPLGSFLVRYATGKTWYGIDRLFGPATHYHQLNGKVDFPDLGNGPSMRTITLSTFPDSATENSTIAESNF
jgi:hypothetical protein